MYLFATDSFRDVTNLPKPLTCLLYTSNLSNLSFTELTINQLHELHSINSIRFSLSAEYGQPCFSLPVPFITRINHKF